MVNSFFFLDTNCTWTFVILFYFILNLFIYFWLRWVFVSVWGLSPAVASGGHSSSRCAGLSPSRPLLLRSTGSRRAGSAVVAHGPSHSAACGILPDQGSNPCPCISRQTLNHCATREARWILNERVIPYKLWQAETFPRVPDGDRRTGPPKVWGAYSF